MNNNIDPVDYGELKGTLKEFMEHSKAQLKSLSFSIEGLSEQIKEYHNKLTSMEVKDNEISSKIDVFYKTLSDNIDSSKKECEVKHSKVVPLFFKKCFSNVYGVLLGIVGFASLSAGTIVGIIELSKIFK